MNLFVIPFLLIAGSAAAFLLYILSIIFINHLRTYRIHTKGTCAAAKVLSFEVMDSSSRFIPFVRMHVEVQAGEGFRSMVDGFYNVDELEQLQAGAFVRIKYLPHDLSQVKLVKEQPAPVQAEETYSTLSLLRQPEFSVA